MPGSSPRLSQLQSNTYNTGLSLHKGQRLVGQMADSKYMHPVLRRKLIPQNLLTCHVVVRNVRHVVCNMACSCLHPSPARRFPFSSASSLPQTQLTALTFHHQRPLARPLPRFFDATKIKEKRNLHILEPVRHRNQSPRDQLQPYRATVQKHASLNHFFAVSRWGIEK